MQLTPQQINDYVAKAVLDSTIGEELNSAIKKAISDLSSGWNNPFESVIRSKIVDMITNILQSEYTDLLRAEVQKQLASQLTEKVVAEIVKAGLNRF